MEAGKKVGVTLCAALSCFALLCSVAVHEAGKKAGATPCSVLLRATGYTALPRAPEHRRGRAARAPGRERPRPPGFEPPAHLFSMHAIVYTRTLAARRPASSTG